jgi:hypothetical protein
MSDASAIADGGCVCVTMIVIDDCKHGSISTGYYYSPYIITSSFSTANIGRKNAWACKLSSGSEAMRPFLPMLSKPGAAVH